MLAAVISLQKVAQVVEVAVAAMVVLVVLALAWGLVRVALADPQNNLKDKDNSKARASLSPPRTEIATLFREVINGNR